MLGFLASAAVVGCAGLGAYNTGRYVQNRAYKLRQRIRADIELRDRIERAVTVGESAYAVGEAAYGRIKPVYDRIVTGNVPAETRELLEKVKSMLEEQVAEE